MHDFFSKAERIAFMRPMLSALFAALGVLVAGGWSVASLRRRLRMLQELRRLHRQIWRLRDDLEGRLDDLEEACQVAALAPPEPGLRASDAAERLLELREGLRNADAELEEFESAWTEGAYEGAREQLMEAVERIDAGQGAVRILQAEVERKAERFAAPEGWAVVARRALAARRAAGEAVGPDLAACADRLVGQLDQAIGDREAQVRAGAGALELAEAAKRAAWALSRLERLVAEIPREAAIRTDVLERWPRILGEARDALAQAGGRLSEALGEAEALGEEASAALAEGDLPRARIAVTRAIARARQLARWFVVGIVDAPTWGGRGLGAVVFALLEAARLPPVGTLAVMGVGLVLAGAVCGTIGHALQVPSVVYVASGDLALGRPALASSTLDPAHGAAMAFDGDRRTAWEPGASLEDPQWLAVDLGKPSRIDAIEVLPVAAPASRCRWAVDVSGGDGSWLTLGTASIWATPRGTTWGRVVAPAGTVARLVRIRPIDWGVSGVAIAEVRVFGPPTIAR